jgi:hypothetical protein
LIAGVEVPESGDVVEAVVGGIAAAAALPQYLPVLEQGDELLDAGLDRSVFSRRSSSNRRFRL